jgi:hypothetical protein
MTWDDAVAKFFPGLDFPGLVDLLVRKGWKPTWAQVKAYDIGRLGIQGQTPFDTLEENVRAYGVCTTSVIMAVRGA